jgi:type IV secretion system protein VirB6
MTNDILVTLYNEILSRLDAFINTTQTSITSSIHSTVIAAATLYFVLYGIAILRGLSEEPFMEIVIRGAKVAIIIALATQSSVYNEWVAQPLMHGIPDGLARAVAGENGGAEVFSKMFDTIHVVAQSMYDKADGSIQRLGAAFVGIVVITCAGLYCGVGVALLALSQIVLSLIVAIGPIFIGLFLFQPTRGFGMGWLGQAVNFQVLYLCILSLGALITNSILRTIPNYGTFDYAQVFDLGMTTIVMTLFGAATIVFLPALASGIVGGAHLPFGNYARTLRGARREADSTARGARLLVGDAGRAVSRVAGSIRKRN